MEENHSLDLEKANSEGTARKLNLSLRFDNTLKKILSYTVKLN